MASATLFDVPRERRGLPELPALHGSPRQCPWADDIRVKKLQALDTHFRKWRLMIEMYERAAMDSRAADERRGYEEAYEAFGKLIHETSARFWIDRRDNTPFQILHGDPPAPGSSY